MKFNLVHVYTLVSVALVGSHAATPEVYWKSVLPNSPMPKTIKDLLYTTETNAGGGKVQAYINAANIRPAKGVFFCYPCEVQLKDDPKDDPNVALLFLENNLHQGTEMSLHFTKDENHKATFLPRKVADSIPFSSKNLPQIYKKFSIKPDSTEAAIMKQTLDACENKGIEGEEKYCATSLESMIDFTTTKLGKKVKAISTEVNTKQRTPLQKYKIEETKKLNANKVVVCHKQNYPYVVFYCHKAVDIAAYAVSLVGADGTKVKATAVCHIDTSKWNPKHVSFQVLKVKPGSIPVCHFLPEDNVVWVPY